MAPAGQVNVETGVALGQVPVDQRAHAVVADTEFLAEHGVEVVQHPYRILVGHRCRPQHVSRQSGRHGGVDALADDVAEEEAPGRPRERKQVVEVATDVVGRRGVEVVGGFQSRWWRQHRGQQRAPQRVGEHPDSPDLDLDPLPLLAKFTFESAPIGGVHRRDTQQDRALVGVGLHVRGEKRRQSGSVDSHQVHRDAREFTTHAQQRPEVGVVVDASAGRQ